MHFNLVINSRLWSCSTNFSVAMCKSGWIDSRRRQKRWKRNYSLRNSFFLLNFLTVVRKCVKTILPEADLSSKDNQEYENFGEENRDFKFNQNHRRSEDKNDFIDRYNSESDGNYFQINNGSPYQQSQVNSGFKNNTDSKYHDHLNGSNDSNLRHDRERGCILHCFFQEMKMVG